VAATPEVLESARVAGCGVTIKAKLWQLRRANGFTSLWGCSVLIVGIICLVLGFVLGISILWTIGIIILVIGAILWILGAVGHPVGGRRHWF
jgi:hypothetical protein